MATSGDWLPRSREGRINMASTWYSVLSAMTNQWGLTAGEIAPFTSLIQDATTANDAARNNPGDRVLIARANEAVNNLVGFMRHFHRRLMTLNLADSDWISLGLRPRDTIRTTHFEVPEKVAFNLEPGAIREVVIHFQIEGADHRAKPVGYDGAVLVWGLAAEALTRIDDLRDGHEMASRTPHTLVFTDDQRGQTVSLALCWQNERGIRGEWSAILSTVIP